MSSLSRREFLYTGLAGAALHRQAAGAESASPPDVHQQILEIAARQQDERRKRFAAVSTKADLDKLQQSLRQSFLDLLDGLPERDGVPPARVFGKIDADDYTVDKLAFESFPGYFVTGLLYKPKKIEGKHPGIIGPCGHSTTGKAAYQVLHINLAKRGYIVLTYDPVGQGERSQFWDPAKQRSRFNLTCGEHAVLGNPLYLLGTSLARYRIHDGMRAIDYLCSLPEVDPQRIGCVGNSGGGTLTAYISALDPRVKVAVPSCYITNLPRRMGNRIEKDADADPEQDIFGFVGAGIDHAGLLALRVPRPTQVNAAQLDFFPIEGARETYAEVKKLYEAVGAGERFGIVESPARHGLSLPLREGAYAWFDRWLAEKKEVKGDEVPVTSRPAKEVQVTAEGQVNVELKSRPLLPLALEQFRKQPKRAKVPLKDLLGLDPKESVHRLTPSAAELKAEGTLVLCVNGNEARPWEEEMAFLEALAKQNVAVGILDPRGVGSLRPKLEVKGKSYTDPLDGVEENIAYNAFLVGKSLLGMRVTDVLTAVDEITRKQKPKRLVLCGRRDAALVALFAAAVEAKIDRLAVEDVVLSYLPLFDPAGVAINAASILPRLLRDHGDLPEVLAGLARPVLAAATTGPEQRLPAVHVVTDRFSAKPDVLIEWLKT
jgi:dienelactone hydrolase